MNTKVMTNIDSQAILTQKNLLILFTYAPTGFGHLRVTDALYDGLANKDNTLIMDTPEQRLTYLHRLSSIHPVLRKLLEWTQHGLAEEITVDIYRAYLRHRTQRLHEQIVSLLRQRSEPPKKLLIVTTHFGLAHQLAKIKAKIEGEFNLKIYLVIQVTDDSPLKTWYAPEADVIFTPSSQTRDKLIAYGQKKGFRIPQFEVAPYPVSPLLTRKLSEENYKKRVEQLRAGSDSLIQVLIPISGAAVGLDSFNKLTQYLYAKNKRFKFHILVKRALYTNSFIRQMVELPFVNLHVFPEDRQMVDQYEKIYQQEQISIEITKPSEQAFKALLAPNQAGGSILLFTKPVGRQEYDNLAYLHRNNLIPSERQNRQMHKAEREKTQWSGTSDAWRGVRLPNNPKTAAAFIEWLIDQGILYSMASTPDKANLDSGGVVKF